MDSNPGNNRKNKIKRIERLGVMFYIKSYLILPKLQNTKKERDKFIADFTKPIEEALRKEGFQNFEIKGRPKSINSIWRKMKKQDIPFEDVYDLFAIRIILDSQPD